MRHTKKDNFWCFDMDGALMGANTASTITTLDKLQTLRLHGMIKALDEQHVTPDINDLSFEDG